MNSLQQISPVDVSRVIPRLPTTPMPHCKVVDPDSLFVDHSYQRHIGEKGLSQIRRVVEGFCWTRFKPPVCAYSEYKGKQVLMVLDGQHTAIAAASNPHVTRIPVMIVDAPETASQAAAFVGQNTDRVNVTPLQLFHASLIARDEAALTVKQVCERAGVEILKTTPRYYQPRQTVAVKTLHVLVDKHTAMGARQILEVVAGADFAPITGHQIRAAEYLMCDKDLKNRFDPEDLTKTMAEMFLSAEDEAKVFSHTHRVPFWKALGTVWYRRTKKRRMHLRVAA